MMSTSTRLVTPVVAVSALLVGACASSGSEGEPAESARPGSMIAFTSTRDNPSGPSDIYAMNADGSHLARVTNGGASHPSWSPDGTKIAFISYDRSPGEPGISVADADGSGLTRLAAAVWWWDEPQWSPDGTRIAVSSNSDDPAGHDYEIYVINADGIGQTRLTSEGAGEPSWSPDGTKIAFSQGSDRSPRAASTPSNRDIGTAIYVMNADGTDQTRLTTGGDIRPMFSPDGSKIAFLSFRDDIAAPPELYVMKPDGTDQTRLTIGGADEPSWSPDGTRVAFTATPHGESKPEVYVMNADGTDQTRLTIGGGSGPSWSPDSSRIAFITNDCDMCIETGFSISVTNADGTDQQPLTPDSRSSADGDPTWGPG